ncbi:50S ribosomal protein L4 [Prosthecochloris sp. HL-130-GSB]|jgi:large subunit ribosomal protein L4|uniref:Large ribosomal subunit protein uL4 n=1 Tax=Prosthecochloris aestuarii TaxID=1102 RepID=A0A831SSR3_PROAE|nr:50S ribosomal protein L4 [Prosthecochloris sp. HL-130-GSB]ARM31609.1 50S ribosomal protein L4 [Prosthecochloris sp. HL-130-GSB]MBO8092945.1 50S ribosomal protein L4 [Prosthecochloris sp.]HED31097.1 50S ribosomal protein L4 [Prosthecochloris aestuarii]
MELKVLTTAGKETGEVVTLDDKVFAVKVSEHAMYLDVKSILANRRQGTHKVKNRSEVRGGGKKPYRQKGTGHARQGSGRSPLMTGGGSIFGPQPRDYELKVNRKIKRLARRSALTAKAEKGGIVVVEDFTFEQIKTRQFADILKNLGLEERKTLVLLPQHDEIVARSGRNIPVLNVKVAEQASTYDILDCQTVVMQKAALQKIEESLG